MPTRKVPIKKLSINKAHANKVPSRRVLLAAWCALFGGGAFLGGCGNSNSASSLGNWRENPILQNAARGLLVGKTYDEAAIAVRNNDRLAIDRAQAKLQTVAPRLAAEQLVQDAGTLDSNAALEKDASKAQQMRRQAAEKYRAALRIAPDFDSDNPSLLNALGYFLAERGENEDDFQQSEKLTRRSLELWDDLVSQTNDSILPGANEVRAARRFMRANTRDSLAWALYRQQKYSEALTEQQNAVQEAEQSASILKEKVSAELYYHLGEINRALKNYDAARTQLEKALAVEPDDELSKNALKALPKSILKAAPKNAPKPNLQIRPQSPKSLPDQSPLEQSPLEQSPAAPPDEPGMPLRRTLPLTT